MREADFKTYFLSTESGITELMKKICYRHQIANKGYEPEKMNDMISSRSGKRGHAYNNSYKLWLKLQFCYK